MRCRGITAVVVAAVMAALPGCGAAEPQAGSARPAARPPGYVIDSIHPPEEALRRFRAGLDTAAVLAGPQSRDALYERFASAVAARDSAALVALIIDRAEYAFLIYPELAISRPPYRQPPEIAWLLSATATGGGIAKLLARADRLELLAYHCPEAEREGAVQVWRDCTVRVRDASGGDARHLRLFGAIVERDGRYKFAGLNGGL